MPEEAAVATPAVVATPAAPAPVAAVETPAVAVVATPTAAPTAAPAAGEPAVAATPAATGDDWATRRTAIAGADEKLAKRLARYSSEKDVVDALVAAQNKIASGEVKQKLADNATPEQVAEWRKDNGLPAAPADFKITPPEGFDAELNKPFLDSLAQTAYDAGMTPAQADKALAWRQAVEAQQSADIRQMDAEMRTASATELRKDWGSEYDLNINLITGLLDTAPEGVKANLLGARLADGTVLGSSPALLRFMASLAREANPTATVVPGAGGNAMQAIESELAGIVGLMGDRKSAYWKGAGAAGMQSRYRELVDVQNKIKK